MKHDDQKIAHLRNLGDSKAVVRVLEGRLKEDFSSLEIAEITLSSKYRDNGLPNRIVGYVAGICGSRESKTDGDMLEDVYSLVYFNRLVKRGSTLEFHEAFTPALQNIVDYIPVKAVSLK